jgi:hypothetical protein
MGLTEALSPVATAVVLAVTGAPLGWYVIKALRPRRPEDQR